MPPCDARRAQGRPTCGRTGGGGVSAVSSVAFGVVHSTTPETGLERHPKQALGGVSLSDGNSGRLHASVRGLRKPWATGVKPWQRQRTPQQPFG
eukprot:COSAG06_NODE_8031_length_2293_cov_10.722425_3_plen_94_part_00